MPTPSDYAQKCSAMTRSAMPACKNIGLNSPKIASTPLLRADNTDTSDQTIRAGI
jgi:hypothetical protein